MHAVSKFYSFQMQSFAFSSENALSISVNLNTCITGSLFKGDNSMGVFIFWMIALHGAYRERGLLQGLCERKVKVVIHY